MNARKLRAAAITRSYPDGFSTEKEKLECQKWIDAAPEEDSELEYAYRSPSIGDFGE